MNQKRNSSAVSLGIVVAVICIIIYSGAIVQAIVRLYLSVEEQKAIAKTEFANIADLAVSTGVLGFMNDTYVETINQALVSGKSLEALIISGSDGEYAFERQKNNAIIWTNNSPRFIDRFYFSSQSHFKPLRIEGQRNVTIQAVANAFDYAVFSTILKETLFLILIGFIIAFITMLVQSLLTKPQDAILEETQPEEKPREAVKSVRERVIERTIPVEKKTVVERKPVAERPVVKKADEPKGLFSPRSNIGWEEYVTSRLESELHRCATTENDLALIMLEFANTLDDNRFKMAAQEAVSFFNSRDLLFENGNNGISVICPGIDLETGMAKSRGYQQRLNEKLFGTGVYVGLSSRSGRLVKAGRILLEAAEALRRARTDTESNIIAFKSDPDKYRAFLNKQKRQD